MLAATNRQPPKRVSPLGGGGLAYILVCIPTLVYRDTSVCLRGYNNFFGGEEGVLDIDCPLRPFFRATGISAKHDEHETQLGSPLVSWSK